MNPASFRKSSQVSNQQGVSPTYQSFRQSNVKTPSIQMMLGPKGAVVVNSKSPNSQQPSTLHSHKNSQVDISQLTKLIKNQKQVLQFKNEYIVSILEVQKQGKELSEMQQSLLKNVAIQKQQQQQQPFVNYKQAVKSLGITKEDSEQDIELKSTFQFLYVIGIGGFGKVWKVEQRRKQSAFAMKEMSKALYFFKNKVITKKSVNSVMNERQLLAELKHPYLVNMYFGFQDRENLYLVMDYMSGGDLRYHIGRNRRFNEDITKFFVACIFVGLEYLHNQNIIHRDIKPENLVLDDLGYVRITDLGIARLLKAENSNDTSGTPGYMAPEVMCRQNHSFGVDYFALGVIAYEFMMGRRPYVGRSRQEIRDQILAKQVQIRKNDIPEGWSLEGADFINRMIQRKPANRLGFTGSHEIRMHSWFKQFPWNKLLNKEIPAPYVPNKNEDNFDQKQIIIEDEENSELIQQNSMLLRDPAVQELFVGYNYTSQQTNGCSTTDLSSGVPSMKHSRNPSGLLN